jgi:ribonuclease HI
MEMTAVIEALKSLPTNTEKLQIYTDSTYLIRGITQWAWGWRKNNWKTSAGDEVSNKELWQDLTAILAKLGNPKATWSYVRGHRGTPGNERCDEIAVAYSKGTPIRLFKGSIKDYSIDIQTPPPTEELPPLKKNYEKKTAFSYLSVVGGQLRRHKDWASCERRVKGQSGARFKKAMDPLQEKEILASWGYDPESPLTEE